MEMELEECKRHVARERTRLIERNELSQLGGYGKTTQTTRNKGKGRAVEPSVDIDNERSHERYKDAVEEKKGLNNAFNLQITFILFSSFQLLKRLLTPYDPTLPDSPRSLQRIRTCWLNCESSGIRILGH